MRALAHTSTYLLAACIAGLVWLAAAVLPSRATAAELAQPVHWPALTAQPQARSAALRKPTWLTGVYITEYYPAPERWFSGKRVVAPGLTTRHRVDWLYSALGVTMQGTGVGLDGRFYHVNRLGFGGWVDERGRPAPIGGSLPIFWRNGGFWRNAKGELTFPLEDGGWSNGPGRRYIPLRGVSFAPGHGRPGLRYWRSLAVDPRLIPMGSRLYIPAYSDRGGGWFLAQDTGGAIIGRHVDVYRSPPNADKGERAQSLRGQRILVVPPGTTAPPVSASSGDGDRDGDGDKRGTGGKPTGGTAP